MEIGIFSKTYAGSGLEETFMRMTSQGIYHTQFNLLSAGLPTLPEQADWEILEKIRKTAQKYHVTLDALSGTFNMIDPDEERRKKGCRQFALQCRVAGALGIPVISLCTGSKNPESKWKWHEDNRTEKAWSDLMHTTEEILFWAEREDVVLGVETEAANIINTPQKARKYLDAVGSDHLKIIMDGANLFRKEQAGDMKNVLDEAFALLGKDIVLAHAKDFCLRDTICFTAPGEGILDFAYYTELLHRAKYQKALIMHGLSEEQVPASLRYLEKYLRGTGEEYGTS